jgi:hypothetical protein
VCGPIILYFEAVTNLHEISWTIWNFRKGTKLLWLEHQIIGREGPVQNPACSGSRRARTHVLLYYIILYYIILYYIILYYILYTKFCMNVLLRNDTNSFCLLPALSNGMINVRNYEVGATLVPLTVRLLKLCTMYIFEKYVRVVVVILM